MFLHKKQQEALDNQVKTLIKKKENENVLTDLELINMKSIFFAV
jgi:type IV secretory pathway VirB4 component